MRIKITWPSGEATAELRDTSSARAVWEALPVESRAQTWGDEVYFDIGLDLQLEPDAVEVVDAGAICYWPPGSALAIPFGATPASRGDECRLASAANVLGQLTGDARALATVGGGETIRVERTGPAV
ncbi:cyclophilin-like fold protein [Haloechinothrix halophila]|uniref:cyclophilin-like fold protein n=1 Tax=Haloechinothrix halophila TaxID=1069073 RepID=UPI00040FBD95|nr:cyclophilin-like fold protein [Haloechinothrix halophila]